MIGKSIMSKEEYIEYWKNTSTFRYPDITPVSFFVRIEDNARFDNACFDSALEAFIYFRYRNVPDILIKNRGFYDMNVYGIREQLQERGCYLRHYGLELLDLLDNSIISGESDPSSIYQLKEFYNTASRFVFDHTYRVRMRICALGHVEEFIRSDSFKDSFNDTKARGLSSFIELEQLLINNEFSVDLHLKMASDFIWWTTDMFL